MQRTPFQLALDEANDLANSSNEPVKIFECDGGRYLVRKQSETANTTHALHVATINPHRDRGWGTETTPCL
jgi:hypothetical protein